MFCEFSIPHFNKKMNLLSLKNPVLRAIIEVTKVNAMNNKDFCELSKKIDKGLTYKQK